MADEDDLYADLYNDDYAGNSSTGSALTAEQNGAGKGTGSGAAGTGGAAPAKPSFIPPAPAAAASQSTAQAAPSTSFIPPKPAAANAAPPKSTGSFIPPPPQQQQAAPAAQSAGAGTIGTAPATNTDDARRGGSGGYGGPTSGASASTSGYSGSRDDNKQLLPHEMPDEGKLFVGGLNWDTTDAGLKQYFTQFGKVDHCLIMRDPNTGRSRGFAFLTFNDPKAVNAVMVKEHYLDGKMIDPKRAIPRQDNARTAKCFVGGVPQTATAESFRAYLSQFGTVLDSTLMMDRETGKPRGYGFATFDNDQTVERLLQMGALFMDGKMIEVKRATPRNADNSATTRRPQGQYNNSTSGPAASTASGGMDSFGMGANPMASMMMNNPMFANATSNQQFDPNALAQFFMQQQQQGGGAFNPMMLQQMMMGGMGGFGGQGNPWMAMNGMGGMGFGGMQGGMNTSPNMAQGQFGGAYGQQGAAGSPNTASMRGDADTGRSSSADRDGRGGAPRAGSNSLPSRPSGLPSRPGESMSPNPDASRDRERDRGPSGGRDYQRERSPQRGSASGRNGSSSRW